jgi:hypothetical protein
MKQFELVKLPIGARLLALALASRARRADDGEYYIWRGRVGLSKITGLSVRAITTARRQLIKAGLFEVVNVTAISTKHGIYHPKEGVTVLRLVRDPAARRAQEAETYGW